MKNTLKLNSTLYAHHKDFVALFAMRTLAKSLCVSWPSVNARGGQILCVPTVNMRKLINSNNLLYAKIENLEKQQISYQLKTDAKIEQVLNALENKAKKPSEGIFYDGQIYDAYAFINDLLKSAKSEVLLIDNYIDDTVFTLFSKYQNLQIKIYTQSISKQLNLDFQKYNFQYKNIELKEFKKAHDRFLIIGKIEIKLIISNSTQPSVSLN